MKYIYTLLTLALLGVIIFFATDSENESSVHESQDELVFNKKFEQWLFDRLKDPATGDIPRNIRDQEMIFLKEYEKRFTSIYPDKSNKIQSLNDWTVRGPFLIGGRSRAIAFDVANSNRLLAGGVDSGMWLSEDGGITWQKTTKTYQLSSVTTLTQDTRPGKQHIWYHGTGERLGSRFNGRGIYKSIDSGKTWNWIRETHGNSIATWDHPFDFTWRIRTNPAAPLVRDEVYAATSLGGIFKSINGGIDWTPVLGGGVSNSLSLYTDIEISQTGVMYATLSEASVGGNSSTFKGIYRSTDGDNWTEITPPNFPQNYNRVVIGIAPSDENQVYFFGETPGHGLQTSTSRGDVYHSIWKYTYNGGDGSQGTWEDRSANIPNHELRRKQMNTQGGYDMVCKVHPENPDIVYLGAVNLYRSDDGWTTPKFSIIGGTCPGEDLDCKYFYRYPNHHADLHQIIFHPDNPDRMYTASDGGLHYTETAKEDTPEWISINENFFSTQFYGISIDQESSGSELLLGGLQDNGSIISMNSTTNKYWKDVLVADGFHSQVSNGADFLVTSQNSSTQPMIKIWKNRVDEDGNLIAATRIDPIGGRDFIWNTPFELDPNNSNRMYLAGGKMIWRNNDLSKIPFKDIQPDDPWRKIYDANDSTDVEWDSLTTTSLERMEGIAENENITSISVSKSPANIVYFGTSRGKVFRIDNANTNDYSVKEITGPMFQTGAYSSCIALDPENAHNLIAVFSNYNVYSMFYSTDAGESWELIEGNLGSTVIPSFGAAPAIFWVKIMNVEGGRKLYLAGTSIGLFISTHLAGNGTVWAKESDDLIGTYPIYQIAARDVDNYVAVGTYAAGTYTTYFNTLPERPEKAKLIYPENSSMDIPTNVELRWERLSTHFYYELQIAKDIDFNDIVYSKNDIILSSFLDPARFNPPGLEPGYRKYYWRVRGINAGGPGEFSEIYSFTTGFGSPELLFPANNATNVLVTDSLIWQKQPEEFIKNYRLQVATNTFFTNLILDTVLSYNYYLVNLLPESERYFWRVSGITDDGTESDFASRRRFEIDPLGSVDILDMVEFLELYPNPFDEKIILDLQLYKLSDIKIDLYDLSGKKLNGFSHSEYTSRIFYERGVADLRNGTYILRININGQVISKKIIKAQ